MILLKLKENFIFYVSRNNHYQLDMINEKKINIGVKQYDPTTGRFLSPDPLTEKHENLSKNN